MNCATCGVAMPVPERSIIRYCGKKCRKRGRNQRYRDNRAANGLPRNGPVDPEARHAWWLRRHKNDD